MTNQNLVHIKLDYSEAREAKKDMLESEANLLRIAQATKRYQKIRIQELKQKAKLLTKIRKIKNSLTKLQQTLPRIQVPEEKIGRTIKKLPKLGYVQKDDKLESELQEIQQRLKELQ